MTPRCVAAREGRQAELPARKKSRTRGRREAFLLVAEQASGSNGRLVYLERRPERGIWGGLWAPPQFEQREALFEWYRRELAAAPGAPLMVQALAPIDHAFTHFDLRLKPLRVLCRHRAPAADRIAEPAAARGVADAGGVGGVCDAGGVGGVCDARGVGGVAEARGQSLWYPLAAPPLATPPRVGLPQPIRALLDRLATDPNCADTGEVGRPGAKIA
jgi:hypothetical protein